MFVAIKNDDFYSVYLVDVSSMTKIFTANVNNAEGLQVVNQEFLDKFNDVTNTAKPVSVDDCLNTIGLVVENNRLRHQQKWNANVNKFNSIVNILFSI